MEFSLFQLLILLLLFYPLIRRLLDSGSKKEQEDETQPGYDPYSSSRQDTAGERAQTEQTYSRKQQETGDKSWEDFFEGLEKVLSGDEQGNQPDESDYHDRQRSAQSTASRETGRGQYRESTGSYNAGRGQRSSQSRSHPLEGPVYGSPGSTRYAKTESSTPSDPYSYDQSGESGIGKQTELMDRELTESENPIYTGLDEVTEITTLDFRGTKNVKRILGDPERLRDGILLKEILGPPKSRRRHHHHQL